MLLNGPCVVQSFEQLVWNRFLNLVAPGMGLVEWGLGYSVCFLGVITTPSYELGGVVK